MESSTERLRALLDERGVEWSDASDDDIQHTTWNTASCWFSEFGDGWTAWGMSKPGTPEQAIAATLGREINGETSDGYHTFNELYHHRAVLFSVIVRDHSKRAWKARKHHDGTMYDGMFIVGIETPGGQATYHYDLDPYWGMFDCEEREFAPEWDGHTPDEAIARIAELKRGTCRLEETESFPSERGTVHVLECSECGRECEHVNGDYEHCPHCLARNVLF